MTRIRREQEKLARIPATLPSSCPVEALAREHRALAEFTNGPEGDKGNLREPAEARMEAIQEAACALLALSPGGAMFQTAIAIGALTGDIQNYCEGDRLPGEGEAYASRAVSALYSVLSVLEAAAGQPRAEFGTDYFCGLSDPRQILARAASRDSA